MNIKYFTVVPVLIISMLFSSCTTKKNMPTLNNKKVTLNDNWTFTMEGDDQVYQATVPGTIHTDLIANNKIPQPFYRENEKLCQWIDKKNWIYSTEFNVDSSDMEYNTIYLNFEGLDTYAEVFLNSRQILSANNMFRAWKVDVTDLLLIGSNTLKIKFISPIETGLADLEKHGYQLPAVNDQSEVGELGDKKVSVFSRKAPYHFGWDWGPRLVTMGIWRPIELRFVNRAEITDVFINQKLVHEKLAELNTLVSLGNCTEGNYKLEILNSETNEQYASKKLKLQPGDTAIELSFKIDNPKLWWPSGYGEQSRYTFKTILSQAGNIIETKNVTTGLRDIKVITEPDSIGKSFYFQVNGIPVFAKGANYIPNDNFLPRVDSIKYETIVKSAVDANMNMLRVWGGGIYENDIFYNLCDKYGILVWQDFMFACSMYPGNTDFIENLKVEAEENIIRLRNHPSVALWCGNNEIDAAWCNSDENCGWGWKQKYTPEQRKEIWNTYENIFNKILPEAVKKYDNNKFYWPSSPFSEPGYGSNSGDMHYWGVWHGGDPFERFEEVKSRFMSEYGFQSFPEMNTIKEFTLPQDWDIYSDVMLSHQRSGIGNQKIKEYLEMYYPLPEKFEDFLYVGQVLQAYGIKRAIDFHRINKPYCMGTLYWQLNDCWPGASWSGIDYYGNWKALHYEVKNAFEPIRVAMVQKDTKVDIYILNDVPNIKKGSLEINIIGFDGKNLLAKKMEVDFAFDKSTKVFQIDLEQINPKISAESSLLVAELNLENKKSIKEIHYFSKPKDLKLPASTLKHNLIEESGDYYIELKAENLEKDVAFYIPGIQAVYSDNYFDLLPGESRKINISPKDPTINVLEKGVVIHTLNSIF